MGDAKSLQVGGAKFAAWLGVGARAKPARAGRVRLLGISKRGDKISSHAVDPRPLAARADATAKSPPEWLTELMKTFGRKECGRRGDGEQDGSRTIWGR